MTALIADFRYALRQLRKSPGFTVAAVLTLAFGIGANSTILSWINATLFDPIPGAAHTENMVTIQRGERSEHPSPPFSYDDYADLRSSTTTLSGLLGYHDDFMAITGNGKPERVYGALVTANYFEVLGVRPIAGRSLSDTAANERAGAAEIVIGYNLWQHRFAGDPAVVGKTVEINRHSFTIVGVAPRGFVGCKSGLRTDIWLPLAMSGQVWNWEPINNRGNSWLNVLGVLRPGVSRQQAEKELSLLMQRIADRYPESHLGDNRLSTDPLWRSPFGANVYLAGTLTILLALAAVLLLLACANVANLLLVRSVARRREFAIRLSMGAGRRQLFRQLMVENLLLAAGGCAVALAITSWTARMLASFIPVVTLPLNINGRLDGRVILTTVVVSVLTAVLAGVPPTLRASALSPAAVLKDETLSTSGGLRKSRLTSGLVVLQVALSLVLLMCAALFFRSLQKAQSLDPGFDPDHVYIASFDLSPLSYSDAQAVEFQRQVLQRVSALPGVQSVTLADFSPLNFSIHSSGILPEGYVPRPHESVEADRGTVSTQYLETMRTPLVSGREFNASDTDGSQPVVMINQALVDRFWPGQSAIGKHIQVGRTNYTVIGVSGNAKYRRLVYDPAPLVLFPLMQRYENEELILHVRVAGDPMAYAPAIERTIHSLNPDLPLYGVTTLKSSMQMGSVFQRLGVVFAGSFGLLAMVLAAVGLYGVISYTTRQRTHEIGIRMALGASRGDVSGQVLRQGLRLTLTGLAAGFAASLIFARFLRGVLFGLGSGDELTFVLVPAVLLLVALAACYLPARRAASTDPMQALRTE
ncbi:MAG: ABC transporter permease [Terracidiphilus sp.]|jgi:predicted permease